MDKKNCETLGKCSRNPWRVPIRKHCLMHSKLVAEPKNKPIFQNLKSKALFFNLDSAKVVLGSPNI